MSSRPRSTYQELTPPAALAPFVVCLWIQTIGDGDTPYEQPVMPDASIDLVALEHRVLLAGPATGPETIRLAPGAVTIGVRFRPGAAPRLIGAHADELRDQLLSIDEVWGRTGGTLTERFAGTTAPATRLALLTDSVAEIDWVATAIATRLDRHPSTPLHHLADDAGLSERQLRRRVETAVGYSPRTLARILRFQRFLRAARTSEGRPDLAGLASLAGYADQAHLTRETRRLGGLPPAALLSWEAERLGTPRPPRATS
jgi:AraC-like DNA-binding protein